MILALILFLLANGISFVVGCVVGRLTAPDKVVTIIHEPLFDLRPSADVIPFRGRVS